MTTERPTTEGPRPQPDGPKRGPRFGSLLLASALVAVVAMIGIGVVGIASTDEPVVAETPRSSATHVAGSPPSARSPADVVFLDLSTGESRTLARSITSKPEATQFVASPRRTKLAFVALGRSGWREIYVASITGREVRQLTDGTGDANAPRWSPDGTQIVFERSSGAGSIIRTVHVEGGQERQVTAGDFWRPSFSSGGREILFTALGGVQGPRPLGLWSIGRDEGGPSLMVANAAYGSWSPDGLRIAYHRAGVAGTAQIIDPAVSFTNAYDGADNPALEPRQPLTFFDPREGGSPPVWSPDGSRIAYSDGASVTIEEVASGALTSFAGREPSWLDDHTLIVEGRSADLSDGSPAEATAGFGRLTLLDVATGDATPVPEGVSSLPRAHEFSVSPDGSSVAYFAGPTNEETHLYIAALDGSGRRRVTVDPTGVALSPSWSPDGTRIVFTAGWPRASIHVLDISTGTSIRLTVRREVWDPSFSRDGRSVMFTGTHGDRLSLWTVGATGGSASVLVEDAAFGSYSPDGSVIAFRRTRVISAYASATSCGACWWTSFAINLAQADGGGAPEDGEFPGIFAPINYTPGGAEWSPNGARVVYRGDWNSFGELLVRDVETGEIDRIGFGVAAWWVDDDTLLVDGFERAE